MQLHELASYFYYLQGHKFLALGALAGLLIAFSFRGYIKDALVIFLLGLVGIFSTYYKRYVRVPPAVELVTFGTVITGVAYGPVAGAVFGVVVTILAEVFNSGIDFFIVGYIPARAAVGFASAFFPAAGMIPLGLWMSVLYNVIAQPLYAFQSDAELRLKLFAFIITNISFNFLAFSFFGELVKGVI